MGAAETVDRIGSVDGPEHPRALQAVGRGAAAGLSHSGTDEGILAAELGAAYAVGLPSK